MSTYKNRVISLVVAIVWFGLVGAVQAELIGQWTFNEVSGDALDRSGNGNDATLVDSPARLTEGFRRYVELNGTSQYASAPAGTGNILNTAPVAANEVTVSAWVRVDDGTAFSGEPAIGKIWGFTGAGNLHEYGLTFGGTAGVNGRVYSYAGRSGSGSPTAAADSIFDGAWHNITFTFEGGVAGIDSFLYFDGSLVASNDLDETIQGADLNFLMGARDWVGNTDIFFFDGGIDEVRVYDHALSQAEVTQLVNGGPVAVPEPSSIFLMSIGGLGLLLIRRRW